MSETYEQTTEFCREHPAHRWGECPHLDYRAVCGHQQPATAIDTLGEIHNCARCGLPTLSNGSCADSGCAAWEGKVHGTSRASDTATDALHNFLIGKSESLHEGWPEMFMAGDGKTYRRKHLTFLDANNGAEYTIHVLPAGELARLRSSECGASALADIAAHVSQFDGECGHEQTIERQAALIAEIKGMLYTCVEHACGLPWHKMSSQIRTAIAEYDRETNQEEVK